MAGAERLIVAFVGENENGILRHLSQELMGLLQPHGYEGRVIDLLEPGWPAALDGALKQGVAVAWGHAGVGATLALEGQCFWDAVRVPFVSVLADPPCWNPRNHQIASRYVVNAYLFAEWLSVQRRFIASPQTSVLVQPGLVPNRLRDEVAWSARPRRMVFVKTGANAEARRASWGHLPRRLRAVVEDAADAAVAARTGDVTDLLLDAAAAHGVLLDGRPDILFGLLTELDRYVRDRRSMALVRALLPLPVDVYGGGWDHIERGASRARFHPAFDAAAMPRVYAETQFMLNTSPNFASGVHERVACGLDARCCVISDENDWTERHLSGVPTFCGIDPNDPALTDRLQALYASPDDYTGAAGPALAVMEQAFDGERYMLSLLELAAEVRACEQFGAYRH